MGTELVTISGIQYKIFTKIVYYNRSANNAILKNNKDFCYSIYNNKQQYIKSLKQHNLDKFNDCLKLSKSDLNKMLNYNLNLQQHLLHPFTVLYKTNILTGEITKILYPITSSAKDINYAETLINEKKSYSVDKIAEGLYLSKQGIILDIDTTYKKTSQIAFQELFYDTEKGYYVGKKNSKIWELKNLTLENVKKIDHLLLKDLPITPKIDITWMLYPEHELLVYKLLESGIYLNKEYTEDQINVFINILSDRYKYEQNAIDKINVFGQNIEEWAKTKKNLLTVTGKKPEEEL